MKISSRSQLKEILICERNIYFSNLKSYFTAVLTKHPKYLIYKYQKFLRKAEYYRTKNLIFYFFAKRRKNILGNKLGIEISEGSVDIGLKIFHFAGGVVINSNAKIGKYCRIHGGVCIGNNGITGDSPCIKDYVDIGYGVTIIGNVTIGNHVKIGANSFVNKNFIEGNCTIAGSPAKKVK